ncbi:MAG: hypothetical protein HY098_07755 [Nitrospinae bacterium]|nr:hypothetical protein [Nitrospinota bacterium]
MEHSNQEKYRAMQEIKGVLVRHRIDLEQVFYSYIRGTAYLSGKIKKDSREVLTLSVLMVIVDEIKRLRNVNYVDYSDLLNLNELERRRAKR